MKIGSIVITTRNFRLPSGKKIIIGTKGKVVDIPKDKRSIYVSFKDQTGEYEIKRDSIRPATFLERISFMIFS